jgi:hypothetical protein
MQASGMKMAFDHVNLVKKAPDTLYFKKVKLLEHKKTHTDIIRRAKRLTSEIKKVKNF